VRFMGGGCSSQEPQAWCGHVRNSGSGWQPGKRVQGWR
jgi:hypothetical protein